MCSFLSQSFADSRGPWKKIKSRVNKIKGEFSRITIKTSCSFTSYFFLFYSSCFLFLNNDIQFAPLTQKKGCN